VIELLEAVYGSGWAPVGISLDAFGDPEFLIRVGVTAGVYALFALGLQLNVGFTGLINFGQAGFMAVGAYAMGILVVKADFSFWLALPVAMAIAISFGLLVGLPSVRLRADYLAIATIAAAEIVRIVAQNARGLTGGNQGLACNEQSTACYYDTASTLEATGLDWVQGLGIQDPPKLLPLFAAVWIAVLGITALLYLAQRTPWGRVLRAIREDEDAARALGKHTFAYKLQSLAIGAALAAVAGFFLALNLRTLAPDDFEPLFTFIGYGVLVLGGLANYWGVAIGGMIMWLLIEGTREIELPITPEKEAALRFVIVGVLLILLMAFRPQGIFGKREEMVLGD
jgi:branched-chain amino acid transport system permease protein